MSANRISKRYAWHIPKSHSKYYAWSARLRMVGIIENSRLPRCATGSLPSSYACPTEGRRTADGVEVTLPASNQELASQIGTVRELVSRNLSRLQSEGMLKIEGRSVVISDLKALEAELRSADYLLLCVIDGVPLQPVLITHGIHVL
ncbi:MAG TPA: helix-turn-helix domain-containing protein [Terriglobales bacterium]|nr:helix-turn-helix domain-containing protein [Terriglobales bacterium]